MISSPLPVEADPDEFPPLRKLLFLWERQNAACVEAAKKRAAAIR